METDKVRAYLGPFGFAGRVREFDASTATVQDAADALGCEPARIAKTLAFTDGDGAILIVAAGDTRVNNRRFRDFFHIKARMVPAQDAKRVTGYPPGGVCPFATPEGVRVFLDISLQRFDTVFPACGSPSSAAEFTPQELLECLPGAQWVDVCRAYDTYS